MLRLKLQSELIQVEEKLGVAGEEVREEARSLVEETNELLEAKVLNESSRLADVRSPKVEGGINELGKLLKQDSTPKPATLNQTLLETHGKLTTVVKVPSSTKTGQSSNETKGGDESEAPAAKLIDSDHNEYVLVRSGKGTSSSTDHTLLRDLVACLLLLMCGSLCVTWRVGF